MTPALQKMWISFAAMIFMLISIIAIYFSRYKLKGFLRVFIAIFAYILMILAGLIILFVVLSGPTNA
jgi:L-asparagine transporter-like permease